MSDSKVNSCLSTEKGPTLYRLLFRIVRRKIMSKNMEWYSAVVIGQDQEEKLIGKDCECKLLDQQVDILLTNSIIYRGNVPLPALGDITVERREKGRNKRGALVLHAINVNSIQPILDEKDCEDIDDHEKEGKEERNKIFAAWLIAQWGIQLMGSGAGVIDVAGGRGGLSEQLVQQSQNTVRCTVIDPRLYKNRQINNNMIQIYQETFDDDFVNKQMEICKAATCFVGMHPDQATETIVDIAFKLNKPFAIVPCCVYPSLFPDRRLSTGQGVKRYNSFLQYLREKDPRILQASLPFAGRNKVLYWPPRIESRVHKMDQESQRKKPLKDYSLLNRSGGKSSKKRKVCTS